MKQLQILLKFIPKDKLYALIGQNLGDRHVELKKCKTTDDKRLIKWTFGQYYEEYAKFLALLFKEYTNKGVSTGTVTNDKKVFKRFRLSTRTFAEFKILHDLFYVLNTESGKYIKIVPLIINEIMSPILLAHLIMADGNYHPTQHYVRIMTNSFTLVECQMLRDAITKIGVTTKVMKDKVGKNGQQQYILTIRKGQIANLQRLVKPHMDDSMLYRIGLGKKKLN